MAEHHIKLSWEKGEAPFSYEAYPRNHTIAFKNGQEIVTASASPAYKGDAGKPDPEDLLVAALSSCHMLSFLAIAAKKKLTVTCNEDEAIGFLKNSGGKSWITRVILRPKVTTDGDAETLAQIHHLAHEACFRQFGEDRCFGRAALSNSFIIETCFGQVELARNCRLRQSLGRPILKSCAR